DDLVCRDRDTTGNGILDERLYALQDTNWNVVALADPAGTVQERFAFSAYGTPLFLSAGFVSIDGSSFEWDVLYCGYRIDPGGLYYVRNRFLHSRLGNWITRDPIGYADGMSLYAAYFVLGGVDPSGTQSSITEILGIPPLIPP